MNRAALMLALTEEEGFRSLVYDDATGKALTAGMLLKGNPTVAVGWNIAGRPCTYDLGQIILRYHVDQTWDELAKKIPWVANLPEPAQEALSNMAFNMRGADQLLTFTTFLGFLQMGRYEEAAQDLETTAWWNQVKSRGPKIQAQIRQCITS